MLYRCLDNKLNLADSGRRENHAVAQGAVVAQGPVNHCSRLADESGEEDGRLWDSMAGDAEKGETTRRWAFPCFPPSIRVRFLSVCLPVHAWSAPPSPTRPLRGLTLPGPRGPRGVSRIQRRLLRILPHVTKHNKSCITWQPPPASSSLVRFSTPSAIS